MLILYGHPFSSYTWKAQIAIHANGLAYDFRILDEDHPENAQFVQQNGGPLGKFPVLVDGDVVIFEATSIIEYLNLHHSGDEKLIPDHDDAAIGMRMLDRVFDNYVMQIMQIAVGEHLREGVAPDQTRLSDARSQLRQSYAWLEGWLAYYPPTGIITLIECAAAPSLFYADWVEQISDEYPKLKQWRTHLLSLPAVSRCVEAARPYRANFPLGAPDRD